ncbi:MAG: hypothetical protein AB7S26_07750 [Sandaracinaceae bacterium]
MQLIGVVLALVVVVLLCALLVASLGNLVRDRWGMRAVTYEPEANDYRGSARVTEVQLRGVPAYASWSAGLNLVWGLATVSVFAPAGFLCALTSEAAAVLIGVVSVSGLFLGPSLLIAAVGLIRRKESTTRSALGIARWSLVHHVAVFAAFVALSLFENEMAPLILVCILPCSIGGALAAGLSRAAERSEASREYDLMVPAAA